ncbi:hypothetical protein [Geothrix fuzhouensis]|uniref:hypothetical protein n=1 Tax=Geothrix fuzhouensis TaxID=2966451 RepID=UPI0021479BF9|nr:hypothetical protein [Geothrix fuzhouensis]
MEKHIIKLLESRARIILILLGFCLIALGNSFHFEVFNVKIPEIIAHTGALFMIVGMLHWLFDSAVRHHIQEEIFSTVMGSTKVFSCGIMNATSNSKDINHRDAFRNSNHLVIGEHYSDRLFDDYSDDFCHRHQNGKTTHAIVIDPNKNAAQFLISSIPGHSNLSEAIDKIKLCLFHRDLKPKEKKLIKIFHHNRILRYSFVKTDNQIWIRMFTNSSGRANVPGFCVKAGTPLFDFFTNDIDRLIEESIEVPNE